MTEERLRERLQQRAEEAHDEPIDYQRLWDDAHSRRRRSLLLVASAGTAAVLVAAAVATVAFRPASDTGSLPTTQTNKTADVPGTAPTEDQLIGAWRAVTILGHPAPTTEPPSGSLRSLLTLRFAVLERGQLWWGGQDWCNSSAGRVRLGTDGQFSTFNGATPTRGCFSETYEPPDVSVPEVVGQAASVRLVGGTLNLYDQDGVPLATFERADPGSTPTNAGLCELALNQKVGSETATTVGTIRRWGTGTAGSYPAQNAFGDAPDSAPAAWCWVYTGSAWAAYGVGPDGSSVLFGEVPSNGEGHAPSGAPAFP
jgi:hypothetical protein